MKESFVFYETWAEAIRQMPDAERLQMYDAIMQYGIYGTKTEMGGLAQMALNLVYNDIDNCKAKRKEKAEKARKSANKRWQSDTNACERIQTHANASERMRTDANDAVDVNVNVNVNGNVKGKEDNNPLIPLKGERKSANKKSALDIEPLIAELPSVVQEVVRRWVDYKKTQFKFTYKSEDSFKTWLKDLYKKSNGDVETMIALVDTAIAKSWKGIYELKNQNSYGNNAGSNRSIQERAERIAEFAFAANGM